jgi:hypothetical protein
VSGLSNGRANGRNERRRHYKPAICRLKLWDRPLDELRVRGGRSGGERQPMRNRSVQKNNQFASKPLAPRKANDWSATVSVAVQTRRESTLRADYDWSATVPVAPFQFALRAHCQRGRLRSSLPRSYLGETGDRRIRDTTSPKPGLQPCKGFPASNR